MKKKFIFALLVSAPLLITSCNLQTTDTVKPTETAKPTQTAKPTEQIVHATDLLIEFDNAQKVGEVYQVIEGDEVAFRYTITPTEAVENDVVITSTNTSITITDNKVKFNKKEDSVVLKFSLKETEIAKELTFKVISQEDALKANLETIKKNTEALSKKASEYTLTKSENATETSETHSRFKNEYLLTTSKGLTISRHIKENNYLKYRLIDGSLKEFEKVVLTNDNKNEYFNLINSFDINGYKSISDYVFGQKGLLYGKNGFLSADLSTTFKFSTENAKEIVLFNQFTTTDEMDSTYKIYHKETLTLSLSEALGAINKFTYTVEDFNDEKMEGTASSTSQTTLEIKKTAEALSENEAAIKESDFYYKDIAVSLDNTEKKFYKGKSYPLVITNSNNQASSLIDKINVTVTNKDETSDVVVATYNEKTHAIETKNPGTALIKVTTASGETKSLEITVEKTPVRAIRINSEGGEIKGGASVKLTAEILPSEADQTYNAYLDEAGKKLATLERSTEGFYTLTANENVEDGQRIEVTFVTEGLKEDGNKLTSTITFITKKKEQAATTVEAKLLGNWAVTDDLSDYVESTLEFRNTGRARLYIHAGYLDHYDCIFDWNKDGNPIYKDGTFHQLDSLYEYDDDYEDHFVEAGSEDCTLQSVVLDGDNLKVTITEFDEDKELIFVKQ